jgi:hypothetical protein
MKDQRLKDIKKLIKLKSVKNHIHVTLKFDGKTVSQLSNVHSKLSEFEKNAVLVHFYKLFEKANDIVSLKRSIENTNYAEVFGSPWGLDDHTK